MDYDDVKRIFDFTLAVVLLVMLWPLMVVLFAVVSVGMGTGGIFFQKRVGRYGATFTVYKIRTIHPDRREPDSVGRFLRRWKLDELPQIFNVLSGDMSFVGPRPDVPGYYDRLEGENRKILQLRPGITSRAAIKYRHEERLLSGLEDPIHYNDKVIFPDKVRLNLEYFYTRGFAEDLRIMISTIGSINRVE